MLYYYVIVLLLYNHRERLVGATDVRDSETFGANTVDFTAKTSSWSSLS